MNDELTKQKAVADEYRKKIIVEIGKTNEHAAKIKSDLSKHLETYKATFVNNEFYMDKTKGEMM